MKKFLGYLIIASFVFLISCNDSLQNTTANSESSATSTSWKTGIALFSFHRHPFTEAIDMADSSGENYVEGFSFYKLGTAFQDSTMGRMNSEGITLMKKMMDERGIRMSSMYVDGAKNVEDWKKYFDLGKQFGLEYLVCEPPKEHWDIIDSLAGIYKIRIAIHEHAKGLSAYWHPDSVLAAIKGHPNIGACADLGHWARSGLNPVDCLKKLEGNIIGLHLKDIDELGNAKAKDVNPGTGVIDFSGVVKELKRQKFSGYMQVECEHNLDNNLADVKEAIRYMNAVNAKTKE
jgi:sugar phosphate isomerase/epimerase